MCIIVGKWGMWKKAEVACVGVCVGVWGQMCVCMSDQIQLGMGLCGSGKVQQWELCVCGSCM